MPTTIVRQGELLSPLAVTANSATSQGFVFNNSASALFLVDLLSVGDATPVTITYYAKTDSNAATAYLLTDSSNAAITHTTQQGRCIVLPESVFGPLRYIIPVLSTGTGTISVCIKG